MAGKMLKGTRHLRVLLFQKERSHHGYTDGTPSVDDYEGRDEQVSECREYSVMEKVINDEEMEMGYGILKHDEGIDLMPGDTPLFGLEV